MNAVVCNAHTHVEAHTNRVACSASKLRNILYVVENSNKFDNEMLRDNILRFVCISIFHISALHEHRRSIVYCLYTTQTRTRTHTIPKYISKRRYEHQYTQALGSYTQCASIWTCWKHCLRRSLPSLNVQTAILSSQPNRTDWNAQNHSMVFDNSEQIISFACFCVYTQIYCWM